MSVESFKSKFASWKSDPRFDEWQNLANKPNIFAILGNERDENTHSRILKFILNPSECENIAPRILESFLKELSAPNFGTNIGSDYTITCEHQDPIQKKRIDILIVSRSRKTVIGIENKIDACEGLNQLQNYQRILIGTFPNYERAIIFLTPNGRAPISLDETLVDKCPVIAASYTNVYNAVCQVNTGDNQNISHILLNFALHLKKEIILNQKLKSLIEEIWLNPDNTEFLKALDDYRPGPKNVAEIITSEIGEFVNTQIGSELLAEYSGKNELWLKIKKWENCGLPFVVLFHWYHLGIPEISIRTNDDDYLKYKGNFEMFAKENSEAIHQDYPRPENWQYWRWVRLIDTGEVSSDGQIKNARDIMSVGKKAASKGNELISWLDRKIEAYIAASPRSSALR